MGTLGPVSALTIYGTTTSPYVRRARIVAHELDVEVQLVNTADEPGQSQMRAISPIWKVPTATVGELHLFDSHTICEYLLHNRGPGPLARFSADNVHERNLIGVIDGALDALINGMYLGRDGVHSDASSYLRKQKERATSAMAWLETWATGPWLSQVEQLGLPEIALVTTLEWMVFRDAYDVSRNPKLVELANHWRDRDSFAATRPPSPRDNQ